MFRTASATKLQSQPGLLIANGKISYSANSFCKIAKYYMNTNYHKCSKYAPLKNNYFSRMTHK